LAACLPEAWPMSLMGNMRELDEALDRMGYLRLSTAERHVRHMGNAVAGSLRQEAAAMGLLADPAARRPHITGIESRLERSMWVHGKLWVTYRRIGRLLDGEAIIPDAVAEAMGPEARP